MGKYSTKGQDYWYITCYGTIYTCAWESKSENLYCPLQKAVEILLSTLYIDRTFVLVRVFKVT